jgi:hypothetical protein
VTLYRWKTRTAQGVWRTRREAAQDDAIEAGVASRDEWGTFWKGVFTEIEVLEKRHRVGGPRPS